ncbi:phosphotransferase enzyme family protein [Paenibacillus sp. GCM10012307]|uniref:Phosphotransferase n=1 Tax=Paenibacillus roseus TaxID=2798579 RepID=A0A934J8V5_9BACL|nr:phosphotransferase [Paenibacillus roseus]MBJ6362572.1 phosphotransferase [Paenibacillus roseus]
MSGSIGEVQAHGMGTTLVRPDWAPIQLEEANRLLVMYPQLGEALELVWHSPRPFSSATIAETTAGRLFIKRHHQSVRDAEGLMEEHHLIAHLHSQGIPVSNIIVGAGGHTAFELDEWTYEIHRLAQGFDLYRDAVSWSPFLSVAHAHAAGESLARMHLAAESYTAPPRPPRMLVSSFSIFGSADPYAAMSSYIAERKALSDYMNTRSWKEDLESVLMPLHKRLAPWLKELKPLWTHNDWHASNLLWSNPADLGNDLAWVETIMDFGLSDRTNAVYDLATALERNTIEWLAMDDSRRQDITHPEQAAALLEGYESVRPLSSGESAALVAMLPLVHVEFALSEIDYFIGIVGSLANADLAYDTFLIGHAKWFSEEAGKNFLDFLERRLLHVG